MNTLMRSIYGDYAMRYQTKHAFFKAELLAPGRRLIATYSYGFALGFTFCTVSMALRQRHMASH